MRATWCELQELGIIQSAWKVPASIDLIIYIVTFNSHKLKKKQPPTLHMHRLKQDLWKMLGPLLAHLSCKYILTVYGPRHDMSQLPTAIRFHRDGSRNYTSTTPEAKWALMEEAREAGTSLSSALSLRQQSEEYGNSSSAGFGWIQKKLWMYSENAERRFADSNTVNLLVDQGSFDGRTYSFSVHYDWELDEGN